MLRKVIKITAWDSPNVKLALAQQARGERPTDEVVTPGVITWGRLQTYLRLWDAEMQQIKLRAPALFSRTHQSAGTGPRQNAIESMV